MVTRGPQANRESDAWGAIGSSPQRSSRGSDSKCVFPSDAHKRPTSRARLLSRNRLRPRFDRRRVSEQIAATTVGCWTVRRRPRKHTSQQRLTVPAGRGKDYRDTVNRGNSGKPPGLLQRAKNQPVVPDADPVPCPVLDTGSSPTPPTVSSRAKPRDLKHPSPRHCLPGQPPPYSIRGRPHLPIPGILETPIRHPRAKRRTSRPSHNHTRHSPNRRSATPVVPSIVTPHPDAGPAPTVGGGGAGPHSTHNHATPARGSLPRTRYGVVLQSLTVILEPPFYVILERSEGSPAPHSQPAFSQPVADPHSSSSPTPKHRH